MDESRTTEPPPARRSAGPPWRSARNAPRKLTRTTRSNSSSEVSAMRLRTLIPGVTTSPRSRKPSASRPANSSATASPLVMSTDRAEAERPISDATRLAAASSRSATTTRAPEPAASRAVAAPIPEAPPMTSTSRPGSEKRESGGEFMARGIIPRRGRDGAGPRLEGAAPGGSLTSPGSRPPPRRSPRRPPGFGAHRPRSSCGSGCTSAARRHP